MGLRASFSGAFALVLAGGLAHAQDVRLESWSSRWRIGGTVLQADADDDLSLVGIHYDLLSPWLRFPELYFGLGAFAAVDGSRGGLLAGGFTLGWLHALSQRLGVDTGVFVGAGGGGDGPVSEGLVLRPHAALEHALGPINLRLEVAFVDLVDDPIDEFHLALGITLPSELLAASVSKRRDTIPGDALIERRLRPSTLVQWIDPASGARTTKGAAVPDELGLIGAGFDYFLTRSVFVPIEAVGAVAGESGGFAAGFGGLGWSLPFLGERVQLELRALIGAGGGGQVDVGGGFLWQGRGGLRARLYGPLSLVASAGYIDAPDGTFEGTTYSAGLSFDLRTPELAYTYPRSHLASEGLPEDRARLLATRFQLLSKTYTPRARITTRSGRPYDQAINLLGVGIEQPVLGDFSLLARGYGAWEGDVGGYAEGLFGAKYELTPLEDERHHFTISMEAGAGGGGGVDVGPGLIWQFLSGWRFDLSRSLSFSAELGYMQPNRGSFETGTFQAGLVWNLSRALLR